MEASSESAHKVFSNDDLLFEILARLPLSSLRLSKSVCKRWLSLITDPFFNTLRSRSPNAHHPYGLLLQLHQPSTSEFAYLPLKIKTSSSTSMITTSSFPFYQTESSTYIVVLQSCNGLLLCHEWHGKFYVYNPTINDFKLLPLPHIWEPDGIMDHMALAFDPTISPHYKVIYSREDSNSNSNSNSNSDYDSDDYIPVHLEIYSSETGNWVVCAHTFSHLSFLMFGVKVVYWRGAIHWRDGLFVHHLCLDDIDNPHFIEFENNKNLGGPGLKFCNRDKLFVSPGHDCLLLVKITPRTLLQMNVYEMNDYSSGWSIKYHVNLLDSPSGSFPAGPNFYVLSVVLGDKEEDSFLVLEVAETALIQYNLVSKTFHQLCDLTTTQIQLRRTQYCHFLFTPSLVA